MRHVIVGAALLVLGLVLTFGAASVLQSIATANRAVTTEPFTIDKIRPETSPHRAPRNEPSARSVSAASRRIGGTLAAAAGQ